MAPEILSRQASPVDGLLSSLKSTRAAVRISALIQIAKLDPSRAAQFQLDLQVVELLRDSDAGVQAQALLTLSKQGWKALVLYILSNAESMMPGQRGANHCHQIVKKISHPAREVQLAALQALGDLGPLAASDATTKDVLSVVVGHKDPAMEAAACLAMGKMKVTSAADKIVAQLQSPYVEVVQAACAGLSCMDRRVDAVGKMLLHDDSAVKASAAAALLGMTKAEDFLPELTKLLGDPNVSLRHSVARTMRSLTASLAPQKPALSALLKGGDPYVAAAAAYVLGALGSSAADQAQALEDLLSSQDTSASVLSATGAISPLPAALRKPVVAAIEALGLAGIQTAGSRLLELLKASDAEVRAAAAEALGRLRFEAAAPTLSLGLKDMSTPVVLACCGALGAMPSSQAAADVAQLLEDPHPAVRARAADALAEMGDTQAFVESIAALLNDKAPPVQVAGLRALVTCGERGQLHAADVCRLAAEGDDRTRVAALQTLSQLGERGAAFATELEPLLDDTLPEICLAARRTLEYFKTGGDAVASLPSLPKVQDVPALEP
eukprot:symbB.v1.2.040571.t1/scaffold7342.1/size14328/2